MDEKFGPFQMKDKRFREMLKDPKLIYIDGSECQDIASELYSQITGTYITFVRGGNGFSKEAFRELQRCFQEEGSDVAVIKIDGKDSLPVKEHNNYCDSFGKDATLDDHACLLHQMYPAYTFCYRKTEMDKRNQKGYLVSGYHGNGIQKCGILRENFGNFRGKCPGADSCGAFYQG